MAEISVVIPTYNRADVLPRAIDSVLDQSYRDFEVVVVDDGSEDHTEDVVSSYDDKRVTYVSQRNNGANHARNNGVQNAESKYISFLDSDDEFHENHLHTVVEKLEEDSTIAAVLTSYRGVYENQIEKREVKTGTIPQIDIINKNVPIGFSCMTIRSSVFEEVGPLDEQLESSQDYDYLIRLSKNNRRIWGVNDILVTKYKDSEHRISDDTYKRLNGTERVLEKHEKELTDASLSRLYHLKALAHAENNEYARARSYFIEATKHNPTSWVSFAHSIASIHPTLYNQFVRVKQRVNGK